MTRADRPPACPAWFRKPSAWQTACYLLYAIVLAFGAVLAAQEASHVATRAQAWSWLAAPLAVLLWMAGGYGFFMLAGTAHEGFHGNLHEDRHASAVLGIAFSAAVPGFLAVGFHASHWQHHRFTNTGDDPDCHLFGRFTGFWSRALLARLAASNAYRGLALAIALGRPAGKNMQTGFSPAALRRLALANFAAQAAWLALYAWLFATLPDIAIGGLLPCWLATLVITGLNPYQEHGDTGEHRIDNARSRTSPLLTLLMCGTNYHLEHHLYPHVPCWRLPRLHRWLRATAWYRRGAPIVEESYWKAFGPAVSPAARYGRLRRG